MQTTPGGAVPEPSDRPVPEDRTVDGPPLPPGPPPYPVAGPPAPPYPVAGYPPGQAQVVPYGYPQGVLPVAYPGAWGDPSAPFGRDPFTGEPLSDKSKVTAGLLQIFLGTLGIGRFYTGHIGIALTQLILTIVGWALTLILVGFILLFGVAVWALIDGIVLLAGSSRDSRGLRLR